MKPPEAKQIGRLIREQRKAKGWTQKELAEMLNVTDKAVSKWENGEGLPDISLLTLLSEKLDITTDELLSGSLQSSSENPSSSFISERNLIMSIFATSLSVYLWLGHLIGQISQSAANRIMNDHVEKGSELFGFLLLEIFAISLVLYLLQLTLLMAGSGKSNIYVPVLLPVSGALITLISLFYNISGLIAQYGSFLLIGLTLFLAVFPKCFIWFKVFYGLTALSLTAEAMIHFLIALSRDASAGLRLTAIASGIRCFVMLLTWFLAGPPAVQLSKAREDLD